MKKITFSEIEVLIEQTRIVARSRNKTLSAAFREWLRTFTSQSDDNGEQFDGLMRRLRHITAGRNFSRDKMNER